MKKQRKIKSKLEVEKIEENITINPVNTSLKTVFCILEHIKDQGVEIIAVVGKDRVLAEYVKRETEKQLELQWCRMYGGDEKSKEEFKRHYQITINEQEVIESREDIEILKLEVLT
jgi:hypothetical protein